MIGAQLRETHTGVVVLCGDRAYKTKKPIATDFLDFSTAPLRERACAREVELNRRLAPDVYLGVAPLTDPTPDTADAMAAAASSWPDAIALDTAVPLDQAAAAALRAWQRSEPETSRDFRHQSGVYLQTAESDRSVG